MLPNDQQEPAQRRSPGARLARLVVSLIAAAAVVVMLLTLAGFAARVNWRCEQMCHFRVQYFWLLMVAGVVLSLAKRPRLAIAAGALAIVNAILVANVYWPPGTEASSDLPLELIAFNVLGENERQPDVVAYLRQEQADIVLLLEVQPQWIKSMESLADVYPHQHVEARSDHFGIALLSREPLERVRTVWLGSAELPTVIAELRHGGRPLLLVGTHPPPPGNRAMATLRNEQLAAVASFVRQQTIPAVIAGDLNATSYSPYFQDLCLGAVVRDSWQGLGIEASVAPSLPGLELAIDHCLVPPAIHVADRCVGPRLGSDHRPVQVALTWTRDTQ